MTTPWIAATLDSPGVFRRWWDKDHFIWESWVWDGQNKHPVVLRGWWDGVRLRPLYLLGWWDGFEVQPFGQVEEVA